MTQFYASIIFIGITLIVVALLWIALDRKKTQDSEQQIQQKKEELTGIITDAEQMIEEMNRFSDYIVTQMDLKNQELTLNLKNIEEKVKSLSLKAEETFESLPLRNVKVVNGNLIGSYVQSPPVTVDSCDLIIEHVSVENRSSSVNTVSRAYSKYSDKVIPFSSRRIEVIHLAEQGLNDTEIAKQLNMGKGEIQLILGMNKS